MAVPLLDLKAQHTTIRDSIANAMTKVIDEQAFILGEPVERFEREVAQLSHTTHAIGCANGTDAILLSLRALNIGRGDEVLTTPFTFFATAGAVHNVGARPVFADIDPDTFNISTDTLAAAIKPTTKAVIAVDLFGQMAPIEAIIDAAGTLPVMEDAAQSIGARRKVEGKWVMAGEAAAVGTFSFFPSKNLGAYGDGGMIVTQNDAIATRVRRLRVHGGMKTYYHEEVGYNSRLDALQAAVLSAKLVNLASWSTARRKNAMYYNAAFADLDDVRTPTVDPDNESIYNQYTLRVAHRDDLQSRLREREIGSAVYYPLSLHLQPCFEYLGYKRGAFPESERATQEVISLPVYPELKQSQLDEVIEAVRGFYGR
ncbi:MAG: DegT/DnrJ/EryC1/StrS family aminotransferase [Gemmatimonadaceae bacterium]